MRALNRTFIAIAVSCVAAATAAAQTPPPDGTPAPAPAPAPAPTMGDPATPAPAMPKGARKLVGQRQVIYTSVGVAESPTFTVGTSMPPGVSIAVGLSLNYDGNGQPNPAMPGMRLEDKWAARAFVYGAYYFYNVFPVAMGAEIAFATGLAPTFRDVFTVQPGLVVYYAPFPVPVVIGTALDLQFNIPKTGEMSFRTVMPGLRIIYVLR